MSLSNEEIEVLRSLDRRKSDTENGEALARILSVEERLQKMIETLSDIRHELTRVSVIQEQLSQFQRIHSEDFKRLYEGDWKLRSEIEKQKTSISSHERFAWAAGAAVVAFGERVIEWLRS